MPETEGGAHGPGTKVLFVFLDGVGLAPEGLDNPLSTVPMPQLRSLLGGPLVLDGLRRREGDRPCRAVLFRGVDACLDVPGLPQSATGQTALFTGVNAAAMVGDHVTAYPTQPLRQLIAERSVLKLAAEAGRRVLFANAHSELFWETVRNGERGLGASTLAAMAANAPIPTLEDLADGRALMWDITHEIVSGYLGYRLPIVPPEEAGARLTRLAAEHDLVLYETFLPDLAGHRRIEAAWVLSRLDAFLGSVVASLPAEATLVVCSDHGNLEDARTKAHTRNPVPLLVAGPAVGSFAESAAITDVSPAILRALTSCKITETPDAADGVD